MEVQQKYDRNSGQEQFSNVCKKIFPKNDFILDLSFVRIETVHLIPILQCFVNFMKNAMCRKMSENVKNDFSLVTVID